MKRSVPGIGITMNLIKTLCGFALAISLVSCGGGGGSPGTTAGVAVSSTTVAATSPTGATTTAAGDVEVTADGSVVLQLLSGAGLATQSISAVEIAQVKATIKDAKGAPVAGIVVNFSESGVGLLSFSPSSKTALTNSDGVAFVEVRALNVTNIGATTITAATAFSKTSISASKNMEITNAPVVGGVIPDPQTLASAINFITTNPADKSIVLQGAGGNGRTETGILTFRVVDKNGTPVKGAVVNFGANPAADITLNIPQGKSDGEGLVITSVSSKLVPTAVVVKATVQGTAITTQSDQLKVTTGVGIAAGFEILPKIYNLDGAVSGDSTPITARLVDANGNKVADGVPVVMVASGGSIGTSSAGGCNTTDGGCSLTFTVQNPRPANGLVTITGSAKVGEVTTLAQQLMVNMSSAPLRFFELGAGIPAAPLLPVSPAVLTDCRKFAKTLMISNSLGYSVPVNTAVSVKGDSATGLGGAIASGNIVIDSSSFSASVFTLVIDPSAANNPPCSDTGIASVVGRVELKAVAPVSLRERLDTVSVTYPSGSLKLVARGTADEPVELSMASCVFEKRVIEAIGSSGVTLPAGSTFAIDSSETSAGFDVRTEDPGADLDPAGDTFSQVLAADSNSASRQLLYLRIRAPSGGAAACSNAPNGSANFNLKLTITSTNGQRNTQTLVVKYPIRTGI